jgi:hypothetical protein
MANQKLLEHTLREAEVGIKIMFRDNSDCHVFNYGTAPDGTKFIFVMMVVPEEMAKHFPGGFKDSKPLDEDNKQ